MSRTTKVRPAAKPAANDSPMAGRELPGMFTLKMLTDDRGEPDAICIITKHPVA